MEGFERIVLEVDAGNNGPRPRKAFMGRWLIPRDDAYESGGYKYAVAITAKGALVVYSFSDDGRPPDMSVYSNLMAIPRDEVPLALLGELAERLEIGTTETLDI